MGREDGEFYHRATGSCKGEVCFYIAILNTFMMLNYHILNP